ncbi:ATP-binding protein [Streptomyces sp. S.PNR 29]|uniref:ATP-binding protein n=1 Tax=Streptomyces sp. S.PNR 29 TaxID=2973805 RepID=UPI0025B0CFA6|nr:ATP-binding protein [Streptomyces sp. S.PNR 29]MDN0195352.1 ATP-binding protein [Streptomyces sp. S.PNR 29]
MKQSVAKTLGVAALGAAFAATGAGAANAAPAVPDAAKTLGTVTKAVPADAVAGETPSSGEALRQSLLKNPPKPGGGLLGGLPVKTPVGLPLA